MSRFHNVHNNFSAGEFSPKVLGRVDTVEYKNGVRLMKNFIPLRNGGVSKRSGSRFIVDISAMADPAFLPFIASETLGYIIAIDPTLADGGKLIRIFKAGGAEMAVTSQLVGLEGVATSFPTDVDPRGFIFTQIADVLFVTHTSGRFMPLIVIRLSDTTFHVAGYHTFSDVFNTLGLADPSIFNISNVLKVPYRDPNISSIALTPSGTALSTTITIVANSAFFKAGHVGAIFKFNQSGVTGAVRITAFTTDTLVTGVVINTLNNTVATTDFEEQAWSDFRGWPRSVTSYEQRLDWGGNTFQPDTIWGSLIGNLFHMMARKFEQDQDSATDISGINYFGDNTPSDPFVFALGATDVNRIAWLAPTLNLNVGTLSSEFVGGGGNEVLSAQSVGFRAQTNYGSKAGKVIKIGDEILFISRDGRKLRNFRFSESNGSNISMDLTFFADHMSRIGGSNYGFVDMAYEKSGDIIWLNNANNALVSFTYQLDNPTVAWAQHLIGGTDVEIIGLTTIPNEDGVSDDVFLSIKRKVNGVTKFYIETIPEVFDADSLVNTPILLEDISMYLDSSVTQLVPVGPDTDTITGLAHLEGDEVSVVVNGFFLGLFTVAGNEIDLGQDFPAGTRFVVGYAYQADLILLPLISGGDFGSGVGIIKRVDSAVIRFHKTSDCTIKTFGSTFKEVINFGTDIFTGLKELKVSGDPERDHSMQFLSDKPGPCNILFVTMRGKGND